MTAAQERAAGATSDAALLVALVAWLIGANLLAHLVAPDAGVPVGLGLLGGTALLAWLAGLDARALGLGRATWPAGLRVGAILGVLAAAGYAAATLFPPVRDAIAAGATAPEDPGGLLLTVLVVLPLATVLPEEFAFRGALWSLLRRWRNGWVATTVSSTLFACWHVLPAFGGGPANAAAADTVGTGDAGTALTVVGTVIFTGLVGVLLCELRRRTGSLLAPIALHWAVNGVGLIVVALA